MRKSIMVILPAIFFNILVSAQVTDNFNDGNFTGNPTWSGDDAQFTVNNSGQLQLNSSGLDSSSLSTLWSTSTLANNEWDLWLRLNFSPSSANYARYYLASDQQNLEGSLHGFYLQFGESGSTDAIELFRQNGTACTTIARCGAGLIANAFQVRIKIKRDVTGLWTIYTDYSGGTNLTAEISGTDTTNYPANYIGLKCVYTSSNATKFYLDDVYAGPVIYDVTPPVLNFALPTSSSTLDVQFSEAINFSNCTATSFSVNPGIGNPTFISQDSTDHAKLHLTFSTSFTNGYGYTLNAQNITDLAGNILISSSVNFNFYNLQSPQKGDLIISEIMSDPSGAPGLPEVEYIELYNTGNSYLSLAGCTISDGSSTAICLNDTISPDNYIIYCSTSSAAQLQAANIPNVHGIISFPGLNNAGDHITLQNANGILLDHLSYSPIMFRDDLKSKGGWSLERIDLSFPCADAMNWKASEDPRGGSPGIKNSVNGIFIDHTASQLLFATMMDAYRIRLHFSEGLDPQLAATTNLFYAGNNLQHPVLAYAEEPDLNNLVLQFNDSIHQHEIINIIVDAALKDCAGNSITGATTVACGWSEEAKPGDIIINEILFNPIGNGSDFVELYNKSNKIIDVQNLKIANTDIVTSTVQTVNNISGESRLLIPGDYIALSADLNFIKDNYIVKNVQSLWNCDLPSYNDDEGEVVLLTNSLVELDRFHYKSSFQFPLLNDVEGISLERISANRSSADSSNWHSASSTSGYATPGYRNSQDATDLVSSDMLGVSPELFTPDNDGEKDILNITIKTDKPGYFGSVTIYDENGKVQRAIAKNQLLGTTATYSWDGMNESREKVVAGIYIIYVELIHVDGTVKHFKKACVVGK